MTPPDGVAPEHVKVPSEIRSFARTSGRMGERQRRAFERHSPDFLVSYPPAPGPMRIRDGWILDPEAVFGRRAPLVIEVGAGSGDQSVSYAQAHPETNVLAIEVWEEGIATTIGQAVAANLRNLKILRADAARALKSHLPDGAATEVWTFFPDPWPKKRHHKRRIVTPAFADSVARVLHAGGVWRLATDWDDYAEQMRDVVAHHPAFDLVSGTYAPRWDERVTTRYESRGLAAGREIRDLRAIRRP